MRGPLNDTLVPPWVFGRSSPVLPVSPTRDCSLRPARLPTVSPADLRSELGPRSLDPDRSFWSAFAELIRGQTSPTDFCNCTNDVRATKPELFNPRRDDGLDHLPFLVRATPSTCAESDTWRAALRSFVPAPVLVPPGCPGLPNRDADPIAPPPKLSPRCIVRINVHRSKDRAKDAVLCAHTRCLVPAPSAYALWRMLTAFPSSASFGHPLSSARRRPGGIPETSDGPTKALVPAAPREGYVLPEDQDAFHRHDTRRSQLREGIAPSGLRAGSLAHAAHTFSPVTGTVLFDWALQGHGAVTRVVRDRLESTSTFSTRWNFRAWD